MWKRRIDSNQNRQKAKSSRCSTVLLCPSLCSRGRCTPSAARCRSDEILFQLLFKLHTSYTSNSSIQFTFSPCRPEPVMLCSASPATTLLSPLTRLPPKLVECLMFLQVAWLESTDYLFLRNNIPDFSRLKGRVEHCLL